MSGAPKGRGLRIGEYSEEYLLKQGQKIVEKKSAGTPLFDREAEDRIPKFEPGELSIGKVLGRGGFCVVSEVVKVTLKNAPRRSAKNGSKRGSDVHLDGVVQDRDFMQAHYLRDGKDYRYAIKKVKEDSVKDVQTFINGIVDLAIEARFLAVIRHPNIIKMRAVSSGTPFSRNYYVVLDRLYDILTRTLLAWNKRTFTGVKKMLDRGGKKEKAFWLERVTVAHDIALALKYLHSLRVIYRDLKPDNIGFDVRGDVKIFDFGLSRQLPNRRFKDGTYNMTGDTGSPRYMAPEVALERPYNETCDVYSFGLLLHQICSCVTPFDGFTMAMFKKKVVEGGGRPKVDPKWPLKVQSLVQRCWSNNISQRPSMGEVVDILRNHISEDSNGEALQDLLDASGKSQRSLHNLMRSSGSSK